MAYRAAPLLLLVAQTAGLVVPRSSVEWSTTCTRALPSVAADPEGGGGGSGFATPLETWTSRSGVEFQGGYTSSAGAAVPPKVNSVFVTRDTVPPPPVFLRVAPPRRRRRVQVIKYDMARVLENAGWVGALRDPMTAAVTVFGQPSLYVSVARYAAVALAVQARRRRAFFSSRA